MTQVGYHTGRLLVATPSLLDPNFHRTVVLLIEHDQEGALGVTLNRPLTIPVSDYLEDWSHLTAKPSVVFSGGPVQREVALAVARGVPQSEFESTIIGDLQIVDLDADPTTTAYEAVRVFSGYSAWAPDQLEAEISEGAWWVVEATTGDPFVFDADSLWSEVLRRQEGRLAMFATMPVDASLN